MRKKYCTLFFAALIFFMKGFANPNDSWQHASVGAYAINTKTGKVLIDQNSDKSLSPGSCMKLVVTAAALQILKPESRFETHLEIDTSIAKNGIVSGNLYIRGGGDPCLGSSQMSSALSWEKQIETWVKAIKQKGIKKIEGKVIGDASKWETALAVPSWAWEDLGNYYGAGACALTFHENSYSLFLKPGQNEGEEASVLRTEPAITTLNFHNEIKTGKKGSGDQACIYGCEFSPIQYLRGTVPLGAAEFAIKGSIPDPAAFCANLLAKALQKEGISVDNQNFCQKSQTEILHTTFSPPLKEIVFRTNQRSVNLYAEHLVKKIGEVVLNEGSTKAGTKAITNFWETQNIPLSGFNMDDGSGLSRKNFITAKQFVSILSNVKKSDVFPEFVQSLPQKNGQIQAKTGSMSLLRCYAGYVGDIAFAILINNCADRKLMEEKVQVFVDNLVLSESQ